MKREDLLRGFETQLVHGGEPHPRIGGAATMPIFQSSTFEWAGNGDGGVHDVRYIRYNNTPNQLAVAEKIAMLERAESALVAGSGMAAISATWMALVSKDAHAITIDSLYGGTHDLLDDELSRFGLETTPVDGQRPDTWEAALRPNTKLFYAESITNPQIRVPDLEMIVAFAREHGLISIVDNTFPSPVNFRAIEFGFDLSLHSCSKYMNGHSDIVGGAVLGSAELVGRIRRTLNRLGGTLDPHAAFLLQRGLKTLSLRIQRHNTSAMAVAEYLDRHPAIGHVSYPGLEAHPDHERARQLFNGAGGMISFTLRCRGAEAADAFLRKLHLPLVGGSLGGPETLMTRPAVTVHAGLSDEERDAIGIPVDLVRLSVGLENTEDLIADFDQALPA